MAQLFRQAALERLSTPEQLDRALLVTTPKAWLALAMLAGMAAAVVVWSLKGEVSTYVKANGILLSHGGAVVDAAPAGAGTLTRILPAADERVEKGSVVAEVSDQDLMERRHSTRALVDERRQALADFREAMAAEDALIEAHLSRQRERLAQVERSARQALAAAREGLEQHRRLFEERVVTRVTVDRSQQAFDRAWREVFGVLRERDDLESRELQRRNEHRLRLADLESRLRAAERQAREIESRLETRRVVAPVSGRVTEIKATIGAVLRPGQPILSIRMAEGDLGVLIYMAPADGKKVEPGMKALVSPSTLRREEYGSLRGRVESVSAFPVSQEGMMAVLQNRNLVRILSQEGAPYSGRVVLAPDRSTASGFAWTSPKASGETLTSGTLASVEIQVESRAPITLVAPRLRESFGL